MKSKSLQLITIIMLLTCAASAQQYKHLTNIPNDGRAETVTAKQDGVKIIFKQIDGGWSTGIDSSGTLVQTYTTPSLTKGDKVSAVWRLSTGKWEIILPATATTTTGNVNIVGQIGQFYKAQYPSGWIPLNGQTITGGVATYPTLSAMHPEWVSGANLVMPNWNADVITGRGGLFLRGGGTRTPGNVQTQATAMPTTPFTTGGAVENGVTNGATGTVANGRAGLMYRSGGGSNTPATGDSSPGEPNIFSAPANHFHTITGGGDVETNPANAPVWFAVASDLVLVASNASVTNNITQQYISYSQVYTQGVIPTTTAPATQNEGDIVVVTSDGTISGVLQTTWVHNGTNWQLMGNNSVPVTTSGSLRTYYPVSTAMQERYTAATTATDVTNSGFTAVGAGVTVNTHALWNSRGMFHFAGVTRATTSTAYTIPTAYIRHELPITLGVSNTYSLKSLSDRNVAIEVWVCNPTTGVPEKRLGAKANMNEYIGVHMNPRGGSEIDNIYHEWLNFEIPEALIISHKTALNTIKLAIRPGVNHSDNTAMYISGYAMTSNPWNLTGVNALATHWNINVGAGATTWYGAWNNATMVSVGAGATLNGVRVPILDTSKDIYLMFMQPSDLGGRFNWVNTTISHTSGDVDLGQPQVNIVSPYGQFKKHSVSQSCGYIIPAATLAAKTIIPTNSGVPYLELNFKNWNNNEVAYLFGITSESVQ